MRKERLTVSNTVIAIACISMAIFSSCNEDASEVGGDGTITEEPNGHKYVDLGLPSGTLWATCNIGAENPEDYGDYFAWGETVGHNGGKTSFEWNTYKWCNGTYNTMTKYCTNSKYGTVDGKTELELTDDAARANWGGNWRMPSYYQIKELDNECNTEWTTQNGVHGRIVTSKTNGNSIFLPATGHYYKSKLYYADTVGIYWSRSLVSGNRDGLTHYTSTYDTEVWGLWIREKDFSISDTDDPRYIGYSIRPVLQGDDVESITLSQTSLTLKNGDSVTLEVTVKPASASYNSLKWSTSDAGVATVDSKGTVKYVAGGSVIIIVSSPLNPEIKSTCTVICEGTDNFNDHEYVDLGLTSGTLWATCNLGATKPEEYGDYFAWGETIGYNGGKTCFDWSHYKWCNGSENVLTKYCLSNINGAIDKRFELELSDDAARSYWGGNWRTPSYYQMTELIDESNTELTTLNGVNVIKVTSKKNGNSIYLPNDRYWSRSLEVSWNSEYQNNHDAYSLRYNPEHFYQDPVSLEYVSIPSLEISSDIRYMDLRIRPVNQYIDSIILSQVSLKLENGESTALTATVIPEKAANRMVKWSSSDAGVATVDDEGVVKYVAGGCATIVATSIQTPTVKSYCTVTCKGTDKFNGHEYVDLGLTSGTLWATCNLGATKPEEYGDYFAWGETIGYNGGKSGFHWYNYKWCNGSDNTLTKYCTNSNFGTVDGRTELEIDDDAAHATWGGSWRIPSKEQIEELRDECNRTWTTHGNIYGLEMTSKKNGNSIFIPAAGGFNELSGNIASGSENYAYYWTRSLWDGANRDGVIEYKPEPWGWDMQMWSSVMCTLGTARQYGGRSIRPVL